MKCGTRSLAVLGALTLSAMGLVPASWAVDASQPGAFGAAQPGATEASQVEAAQGESAQVAPSDAAQAAAPEAPQAGATTSAQPNAGRATPADATQTDEAEVTQADASQATGANAAQAPQAGGAQATQPAQSENSAQSGDLSPGLVDTPISDIQAVGAGDDSAMVGAVVTTVGVTALNEAVGSDVWAFVPSPPIVPVDEDVIRSAFIYKKATVSAVGTSVIHDDAAFSGLARQPLAQEFARVSAERGPAASFVVIANHFKSKGCVPEGAPPGNTDCGDGQGNANAIRVAQASSLVDFAARFAGNPTLLVGDFNSYSQEDPIKTLQAAGWTRVSGEGMPSYVYSGRSGSLHHVFVNEVAKPLLAGVTSWAVNAQESIAFEYSRAGMNAHLPVEAANPYRSSDHNPEIIGLTLLGVDPAPTPGVTPSPGVSPAPTTASSPTRKPATPAPSRIARPATASSRDTAAGARPSAARSASRARGPAPRRASVLGFSWPEREAWPCPSPGARSADSSPSDVSANTQQGRHRRLPERKTHASQMDASRTRFNGGAVPRGRTEHSCRTSAGRGHPNCLGPVQPHGYSRAYSAGVQ